MSNNQQAIPDTPASPDVVSVSSSPPQETDLAREARLADEREVEEKANRRQVLDEMLATQAKLQKEAAIVRAENERREARKEKARRKELPDLSAERFSQEMRNNGTAQQQGDWRALVHEVRRAPVVLWSQLTTAIFFRHVTTVRSGGRPARPAGPSSARRASSLIGLARG
jgi:hypothetical protein